jgi:hypothetical protein
MVCTVRHQGGVRVASFTILMHEERGEEEKRGQVRRGEEERRRKERR